MSTLSKTFSKAVVALTTVGALATTAFAQSYSSSSSADTAAGAGLGVMVPAFYCCLGLFGLVFYAFNIWMFIDVLKRTEVQLPNRTLWMVLLIVGFFVGFGWIVGIVYYFTEKKKLDVPAAPVK